MNFCYVSYAALSLTLRGAACHRPLSLRPVQADVKMTEIRPLAPGDRAEWELLYRGYADFYGVETSADKLATLFDWLMDPAHPCKGLVAVAGESGLAGLAHYRAMPSPLRGAEVGFLDDLSLIHI